jgi:hypothetical protein
MRNLYGFCYDLWYKLDFGKDGTKADMRSVRGFYISLLIHVAVLVILILLPKPEVPQAPMTFEVLNQDPSKRANQIVRAVDLPEAQSHPKDEQRNRFWSESTRTVEEEQRAQRSGLTKNRAQNSKASKAQKMQVQNPPPQRAFDKGDFSTFLPKKITPPKAQAIAKEESVPTPESRADKDLQTGFSTLAEDLPSDIKVGSITAVDTERYLYYSYFSRAQEMLWNEWAPMVQSLLSQPPSSLRMSSQNQFTTFLEVWFYPNGQVHSTHLMKPSGIPEFDYVASTSFKRIGLIPNPPREKIDPDGLIRFKWALTVEYDPKVLVRK